MDTRASNVVNLAIDSMTCGHCTARVTEVLSRTAGVKVDSVSVGGAQLAVVDAAAAYAAVAALTKAGYPARVVGAAKSSDPPAPGCCGGTGVPEMGQNPEGTGSWCG